MSTFGARFPTFAAVRDSHLVAYYEVLDRFSAEMERRLMGNNSTLTMLAISDPRDERFLDGGGLKLFCQSFHRFNITETEIT